jgi:hypothetical protein
MRARLTTALRALLAIAVLSAVFAAYLRPGFVLDLANRLWLCW